jgi:chorismate mutase
LEKEYASILEGAVGEAGTAEIKAKLEETYKSKRDFEMQMLEDLKQEIARKGEENEKLKASVEDLQRRAKSGANGALPNGKTVAQQIADFDQMKKSLMRDLQNRCERVGLLLYPRGFITFCSLYLLYYRWWSWKSRSMKRGSSIITSCDHQIVELNRRRWRFWNEIWNN